MSLLSTLDALGLCVFLFRFSFYAVGRITPTLTFCTSMPCILSFSRHVSALTPAELSSFWDKMTESLIECKRRANRRRVEGQDGAAPLLPVPFCYECGHRLGHGKGPGFSLHRWGGAHFCSEPCKMRKQNRANCTAVTWAPVYNQGEKDGTAPTEIMSTRLAAVDKKRTDAERVGSHVRSMKI
jgi:hypothetical protein